MNVENVDASYMVIIATAVKGSCNGGWTGVILRSVMVQFAWMEISSVCIG